MEWWGGGVVMKLWLSHQQVEELLGVICEDQLPCSLFIRGVVAVVRSSHGGPEEIISHCDTVVSLWAQSSHPVRFI